MKKALQLHAETYFEMVHQALDFYEGALIHRRVACPFLGGKRVLFTEQGFHHFFDKCRTIHEVIGRFRWLPAAPEVIEQATNCVRINPLILPNGMRTGKKHYVFRDFMEGRIIEVIVEESQRQFYFLSTKSWEKRI